MAQDPSPYTSGYTYTASDTAVLPIPSRAVQPTGGGAGNVKVDMVAGGTITLAVVAGQILPIAVTRIYASGSTAATFVVLL